jgi:NTP pyrophosphatase (non-canonical NTP hydrolase)
VLPRLNALCQIALDEI